MCAKRLMVISVFLGILLITALSGATTARADPNLTSFELTILGAGVLALGALIAATIIVQNELGGLPIEAYLRALGGPVLMILPGVLDVRVTLGAERQGRDAPECSRQQEDV